MRASPTPSRADTLVERLPATREAGTSSGPSGRPEETGPRTQWIASSGTTISGPYIAASVRASTSGAPVSLHLSCYPANPSVGLDVNFQTAGRTFDFLAGGVTVEYRFGSQDESVSETWSLFPGEVGTNDVVYSDDSQRPEFVRLLRADDSHTLQVDLGDSISVQMDLTGAEQSAFPVLEACGY